MASKKLSALAVAQEMRHDVEIFYSKHRGLGNMYFYAFNHALATKDPRKMLTALKAMEDDMDIFYTKHREPGNRYYAAYKAVIGKGKSRTNPAPGPAERSDKFHKLRAKLMKARQVAAKKGDPQAFADASLKVQKLDRMFYAPRTINRRKR